MATSKPKPLNPFAGHLRIVPMTRLQGWQDSLLWYSVKK